MIKFNVPNVALNEAAYVSDVIERRHFAGKGHYNKLCKQWFKDRFGFENTYLTPSCTDALEMAAILCGAGPGDEVIVPSYTFVSTANAFATKGARIVYADSKNDNPNVDLDSIKSLVNAKTKAIIVVHYGGFSCDIEAIQAFCKEKQILLVEDAACALGSESSKPLGSFGDIATFSFHETKNVTSGKGGLIVVNNQQLNKRAPVVWEKGTNRAAYFNGEVDKYGWVDYGSSFMMPEVLAAFLFAQLENFENSQTRRKAIWDAYHSHLGSLPQFEQLRDLEKKHNAHCFYGVCENKTQRQAIIEGLKTRGIQVVFHYQALHESNFSKKINGKFECPNATMFEECLFRLPIYSSLEVDDAKFIIDSFTEVLKENESLV